MVNRAKNLEHRTRRAFFIFFSCHVLHRHPFFVRRYRPLVVTTWHDGSPDTPKGARTARYMPRHPTKIEVDAFTSVAAHLFQSSGPPSVAVNHLLGRQDRICSGAQKLLHTLSWEQQGEAWQGKAQAQAQAMRTW